MFSSLLASVSSIVPVFSTPAAIHSMLQFNGKWDIHGVFSYTYAYEIQIPHQASFADLLQVIRNTVPSSYGSSFFKISHISDSCSSHVVIDDDTSLYTYIRLKIIHCGVREFPFCVELTNFSENIVSEGDLVLSELHQPLLCNHSVSNSSGCEDTESDGSLSDFEANRTLCIWDEGDIPAQMQFSPGFVLDTFRGDEMPVNNVQTNELDCSNYFQSNSSSDLMSEQDIATMKEMHVTSRFDPTRIVVDAIYASKKDLDIHLKMLAISNQFQYRIRTSKKSCLHVVCVDFPRCTWAVRDVRLPGVEMFQIRRSNFHGSEKLLYWKFYGAARAASEAECNRYLKYLDRDDPRIIGYLKAIGKEKWARSRSNQRYSIMTSNLAESMNNVDVVPCEYPISQLVDFLMARTQRWFHERRELANSTSSTLTKF
ncbi:unnamed protein product [Cuscuta campestris]|uniref:Uncharacterized protein n=1 Tax=Cuscuta campestris TaxID=132261 RepID=A0A484L0N8_9ASTE|nr:unnamed protein product [Cuscuta campestris]